MSRPPDGTAAGPRPLTRWDRLKVLLAAGLIRALVALLGRTWRWRVVRGREVLEELFEAHGSQSASKGPGAILAYWHNHTLVMARYLSRNFLARGFPLAMLASWSRDGELGARLARAWGGTVYRGSASRGGTEGLRRLFRHLRGGGSCVLSPDGPRGPIYEVKPGAVVLSQMTGAALVPVGAAADRCWRLRSWDRLLIPKPFARVLLVVGEPQVVAADRDPAAEQERLAGVLTAVAEEAEQAVAARGASGDPS